MKNRTYKAVLFHPEGDFVTDFTNRNEIEDVWDMVNDMGSRWIFYPIVFVATDTTIVDTPEGLELLKGKRIKTVKSLLAKEWKLNAQKICDLINEGMPLSYIYSFKFTPIN
jgi:hypothetical protein